MVKQKKRAPPNQPFPNKVARDYYKHIRELMEELHKNVWKSFDKNLRNKIHNYRGDDALDDIQRELTRLKENADESLFRERELEKIASNFIQGINNVNKKSVFKQLKAVLGVDPVMNDKWLDSFMRAAIQENVNYIKSIEKQYFDKIETIIYQGTRRGNSLNEMAHEIKKSSNSSIKRARFIARDQAGSIYGDMTKKRNEEAGVEKFVWVTSRDERVRGNPSGLYPDAIPNHWELDKQVFTWNKGVEKYGGLLPGEDYNCRCTSKPYIENKEEE